MKRCSKCTLTITLNNFSWSNKAKQIYRSACKSCIKKSAKLYNSKPEIKDKIKIYNNKPETKEKIRTYKRPNVYIDKREHTVYEQQHNTQIIV